MQAFKYITSVFLFIVITGCSLSEQKQIELIGHRGATGLVPENTLPGFKKALEYDVDAIELDVVISGDGKVVVSHEPWFRHDICLTPEGDPISKASQKEHLIYGMEYKQIAEYDCGSLQREGYPDQQNKRLAKPLLSETIREVEDYITENGIAPVGYKVEIKSKPSWYEGNEIQPVPEEAAEMVHKVLVEEGIIDRVNIFAFNPRVLDTFEQIAPSVPRVFLIPTRKTNIEANLSELASLPDVYASNYRLVDSSFVREIHNRGMKVYSWTVNDYDKMIQLVNMGVDGIISDYPNYYDKLRTEL